ncbi:MAG TPA: hypothetical protein VGL81_21085 [Polyangiaceae bacterium]|jgi:hypothetical protein
MTRAHVHAIFALLVASAAACGGGTPPPAAEPAAASASAAPEASASAAPEASASAAPEASAAPAGNAAPAASAAPAAASGPTPPGPGEWDKWTKDQKKAYMKDAVLPKMAPLFHDYDAKRFAEIKCTTCHGAGAKAGNFKMPNAALPKLPASEEGFKKLHDAHPKAVDFMSQTVVPTMAALVGEEPFDMKTGKGFGCFECHTKKK